MPQPLTFYLDNHANEIQLHAEFSKMFDRAIVSIRTCQTHIIHPVGCFKTNKRMVKMAVYNHQPTGADWAKFSQRSSHLTAPFPHFYPNNGIIRVHVK